MIDLTPLDVRNKRGDFKKGMRGYEPQEVDVFLELVAERLEALVRENIQLRDRTQALQEQVDAQAGREQAVQDALVTAQELRKDIREQSQREADHVMREAESEARRMIADADAEVRSRLRGVERQIDHLRASAQELERRRSRFLRDFRTMLQRELDFVDVEEDRTPLEERVIDLDLGSARESSDKPVGPADKTAGAAVAQPSAEAPGSAREPTPAEPSGGATQEAGEAPASSGDDGDTSTEAAEGQSAEAEAEGEVAAPRDQEAGADGETSTGAAPAAESEAAGGHEASEQGTASPVAESETTVDVADLHPGAPDDDQPSSLEVELMAGMAGADGTGDSDSGFPDVPDLETVLAEAGIDEVNPSTSEEISPPPADRQSDDRRPEDRLAFFDKDDEDKKKKR